MAKFSVVTRFSGVGVRATKKPQRTSEKVTSYEVRLASWKSHNAGETVYSFNGINDFIQYAKVRITIERNLTIKHDSENDTIYLEE